MRSWAMALEWRGLNSSPCLSPMLSKSQNKQTKKSPSVWAWNVESHAQTLIFLSEHERSMDLPTTPLYSLNLGFLLSQSGFLIALWASWGCEPQLTHSVPRASHYLFKEGIHAWKTKRKQQSRLTCLSQEAKLHKKAWPPFKIARKRPLTINSVVGAWCISLRALVLDSCARRKPRVSFAIEHSGLWSSACGRKLTLLTAEDGLS